MSINETFPIPTGYLFIGDYDKGQLETLTIGDYGKHHNIKADFLGYDKELDGVPNISCMPLSEKWVVTLSTQYGCPLKCTFCFDSHTQITMGDGTKKNISEVTVGDDILSFNEHTNETTINQVRELFKQKYRGEMINIELEDGGTLKVTPAHPFLVKDNNGTKWVEAQYLSEKQELIYIS